jgi:hypothetical protein
MGGAALKDDHKIPPHVGMMLMLQSFPELVFVRDDKRWSWEHRGQPIPRDALGMPDLTQRVTIEAVMDHIGRGLATAWHPLPFELRLIERTDPSFLPNNRPDQPWVLMAVTPIANALMGGGDSPGRVAVSVLWRCWEGGFPRKPAPMMPGNHQA